MKLAVLILLTGLTRLASADTITESVQYHFDTDHGPGGPEFRFLATPVAPIAGENLDSVTLTLGGQAYFEVIASDDSSAPISFTINSSANDAVTLSKDMYAPQDIPATISSKGSYSSTEYLPSLYSTAEYGAYYDVTAVSTTLSGPQSLFATNGGAWADFGTLYSTSIGYQQAGNPYVSYILDGVDLQFTAAFNFSEAAVNAEAPEPKALFLVGRPVWMNTKPTTTNIAPSTSRKMNVAIVRL